MHQSTNDIVVTGCTLLPLSFKILVSHGWCEGPTGYFLPPRLPSLSCKLLSFQSLE